MPVANGQHEDSSTSPVAMMLREVRFVNAYIEHGIAVKAAREAGIQGGSDDAIRKLAYQMLAKPTVAQYLRECRQVHLKTALDAHGPISCADRMAFFGGDGEGTSPGQTGEFAGCGFRL